MKFLSRGIALLGTATLLGVFSADASAQPVYRTSFESSGDPSAVNYTLGNLNGQGGWSVSVGGSANVANSPLTAPAGSNYVAQGASSVISRNLTGGTPTRVLVEGWYRGTGGTLVEPPAGANLAAVLGFRNVNASTFTIAAYDGVDEEYKEAGGVTFSSTQWHRIVMSINYSTKKFDIMVNNQPLLQGVNFFDPNVTALTGFQSSTQNAANVDGLGFYVSDGDYDGDGIPDDVEMITPGADPLDPDLPNINYGDVTDSGDVTPVDAHTVFLCWLSGSCSFPMIVADVAPDDGDGCIGFGDGDGNITPEDAQRIFNLYLGIEQLCP